jgi:3-dehydroquinate dehydratase-2
MRILLKKKILVVHGPNLNMLGEREPDIYGHQSLDEIDARLQAIGDKLGIDVETFQSNHEGVIVEKIQQAAGTCDGMLINPAAYTHTSIAIRDALALLSIPIVEIHLSNIYKREPFRHKSMIADVVDARIAGFGPDSYVLALEGLARML